METHAQVQEGGDLEYKDRRWSCLLTPLTGSDSSTCTRIFSRLAEARSHLLDHYDPSRLQCGLCLVSFSSMPIMKRHKKRCYSLETVSEVCCGKELSPTEMTEHKKSVHCELCDFIAQIPALLRQHTTRYHRAGTKYHCQAEGCKAEFDRTWKFRHHTAQHGDKKECEVCGKLVNSSYISRHRQTHKSRSCEDCHKVVKLTSLNRHKKICKASN